MNSDKRMWGGRFDGDTDQQVAAFTASVEVDQKMALEDIRGSIAHATMLGVQGVLTSRESKQIVEGLESIAQDIREGRFEWRDELEDVHMNVERALSERIGPVGGKLHTARSRNDQVATDFRLWLRKAVNGITQSLHALRSALVEVAQTHLDVVMPGYTHLQVAQPVLFSHHMMAYYEMFTRDQTRFKECLQRIDVSPLGAGALAGTGFPIDSHHTATILEFQSVAPNSMDAVASRDFAIEFLSNCAMTMVHLSRMSEEMILWSSQEFGFVTLPDSHTTGSSIMPQKKNPDVCELVRGKTGGVCGHLMALLMTMKGLPMSYNRDMQEDKAGVFDAAETVLNALQLYTSMLPSITVHADRMQQAAGLAYSNATDLADYLARKGLPFREAHEVTGSLVAECIRDQIALEELPLVRMKTKCPLIDTDVYQCLSLEQVVNSRVSFGGTSRLQVEDQIENALFVLQSAHA